MQNLANVLQKKAMKMMCISFVGYIKELREGPYLECSMHFSRNLHFFVFWNALPLFYKETPGKSIIQIFKTYSIAVGF